MDISDIDVAQQRAACDATSVHFGPTIRRTDILAVVVVVIIIIIIIIIIIMIVVSYATSVFGAMGSVIGTTKRRHSITADAKAIIEAQIMQVVCFLIRFLIINSTF